MSERKTIEIFVEGCDPCKEMFEQVNRLSCGTCDVRILDVRDPEAAERFKSLGLKNTPAMAVDGKPGECCAA